MHVSLARFPCKSRSHCHWRIRGVHWAQEALPPAALIALNTRNQLPFCIKISKTVIGLSLLWQWWLSSVIIIGHSGNYALIMPAEQSFSSFPSLVYFALLLFHKKVQIIWKGMLLWPAHNGYWAPAFVCLHQSINQHLYNESLLCILCSLDALLLKRQIMLCVEGYSSHCQCDANRWSRLLRDYPFNFALCWWVFLIGVCLDWKSKWFFIFMCVHEGTAGGLWVDKNQRIN